MTPEEYRIKNPDCKYCEYSHHFTFSSGIGCYVTYEEISARKTKKVAEQCEVYKPGKVLHDEILAEIVDV